MKRAMVIAVSVLALSALACSANGGGAVSPVRIGAAVQPHVLQSNSPTVLWEFPQSDPIIQPVPGPDGHIWGFAFVNHRNFIFRLDPATLRLRQIPAPFPATYMTAGPDGNVWFCSQAKVGKMTPSGVATTYNDPNPGSGCRGITAGPDGNLWLSDSGIGFNQLLRVSVTGEFTAYPMLNPSNTPFNIVGGENGLVWFLEGNNSTDYVSNIDTATGTISEFPLEGSASDHAPVSIDSGADGNAYVLDDRVGGRIYRVTPSGTVRGFRVSFDSESQSNQADVRTIWIGSGFGLIGWDIAHHLATNYGTPPTPPPPPKGPQTFPVAGPDGNAWMAGGVYILRVLSVLPQGATITVNGSQVFSITESDCSGCSWKATSSNPGIAAVSGVTSGQFTVTGVAPGSAIVTVTDHHRNAVQVGITVQ